MIAFIDDHRQAHSVEPICKVLPIAPSTFYAHVERRADLGKLPARARSDVALMATIRRVYEANFGVYGCARPGGSSAARAYGGPLHSCASNAFRRHEKLVLPHSRCRWAVPTGGCR